PIRERGPREPPMAVALKWFTFGRSSTLASLCGTEGIRADDKEKAVGNRKVPSNPHGGLFGARNPVAGGWLSQGAATRIRGEPAGIDLSAKAARLGIEVDYVDGRGRRQIVPPAVLQEL